MIFVTAGSMLPFDRLFQLIDAAITDGVITDQVYGQIGEGEYLPKNFEYSRFIDKVEFDERVLSANLVVAHAGIGVIMQALSSETPLLVLSRKAALGEHVNDHQVSTAKKFEELGHVVSFEEDTLVEKLEFIKTFKPAPRSPNVAGVGNEVSKFLATLI